jgi:lysophospholipase L1-like esterase
MFLSALASRRAMRRAVAIAAAAAAIGGTFAAASAGAATSAPPPVHTGAAYLALGDSVPFGFREPTNLPQPDYPHPKTLTGYPELVAKDLNLRLKNAACPGETTSSFINVHAQSNGCENVVPGSTTPPYRPNFPLHAKYAGSQLAFAVNFLKTHPGIRLVSIMLGANDGFVCQEEHGGVCGGQDLVDTLTTIHNNLDKIFKRLRGTGYKGQITVVNYYSNDYADSAQTGLVKGLNQVIDAAASPYNVEIAPTFLVWRYAAKQTQGDDCAAGLLTILRDPSTGDVTGCGVHPSLGGHALIASAVERVLVKS